MKVKVFEGKWYASYERVLTKVMKFYCHFVTLLSGISFYTAEVELLVLHWRIQLVSSYQFMDDRWTQLNVIPLIVVHLWKLVAFSAQIFNVDVGYMSACDKLLYLCVLCNLRLYYRFVLVSDLFNGIKISAKETSSVHSWRYQWC